MPGKPGRDLRDEKTQPDGSTDEGGLETKKLLLFACWPLLSTAKSTPPLPSLLLDSFANAKTQLLQASSMD